MTEFYHLKPGAWSGFTDLPVCDAQTASSPVWIVDVEPRRRGDGTLRLSLLQPLHSGGSRARAIEGKVVQRAASHITMIRQDDCGQRTSLLAPPSPGWLYANCPLLLARRPWTDHVGNEGSSDEYLANVFGAFEEMIVGGAVPGSFGRADARMPARSTTFDLEMQLEPLESVLVARGLIPRSMEDKWFIYLHNGALHFRRSWTGFLIYKVEARWTGVGLWLGQVLANRDPDQYNEIDDAVDQERLRSLINVLLRGLPA